MNKNLFYIKFTALGKRLTSSTASFLREIFLSIDRRKTTMSFLFTVHDDSTLKATEKEDVTF